MMILNYNSGSPGIATFIIAIISFVLSIMFLLSAYVRTYFQKPEKNKYILAGVLVFLFILSCVVTIEIYSAMVIISAYLLGRFVPLKINLLKIGLIFLLISGISLLLTSVLCGWYR